MHLAGGDERQAFLAVRAVQGQGPRGGGAHRPRRVAARRVALLREGADALLPDHAAQEDVEEADRPPHQGALPHRAGVRGAQGGAGARPLRRAQLRRLASPYIRRPLLLRLPGGRALTGFSPLGPRARSRRYARSRGLSDTSPTPSRPSAAPWHEPSWAGCRAAPSAIAASSPEGPGAPLRPDPPTFLGLCKA